RRAQRRREPLFSPWPRLRRRLAREGLVVALEQVLAISAGQLLVLDRARRLAQAPAQRHAALRGVEGLEVLLADEQGLDQGGGFGELGLEGGRAVLAQHVVGVLASGEAG